MRQGRIYRPDQASRALRGFFREGNLAALREMALRRTAERVDADVTGYMRANAIAGPWPAGDRVMALVGADPAARDGGARGAPRGGRAEGAALALHVEQPSAAPGPDPGPALPPGRALGATGPRSRRPAGGDPARGAGAQCHAPRDRPRPAGVVARLTGRTLSAALLRQATDFTLHLVRSRPAAAAGAGTSSRALPAWVGWAALRSLVAGGDRRWPGLDGAVPEGALGMIYLRADRGGGGGLRAGAGRRRRGPVLPGPGISCSCRRATPWPSPGRRTWSASWSSPWSRCCWPARRAGSAGRCGRRGPACSGLRRLVEFSRRLGAAGDKGDLVQAIAEEASRIAGGPACVLLLLPPLPGETAPEPVLRAAVPIDAEPDEASMAAARWAAANRRPPGAAPTPCPPPPGSSAPCAPRAALPACVGLRLGRRRRSAGR